MTSLGETVNQLSDKLSTLVPGYNHSFSSSILKASSLLTMERIGLGLYGILYVYEYVVYINV